jgi:hypothetical protein
MGRKQIIAISMVALAIIFVGGKTMAYEEPKYQIIQQSKAFEIRMYKDRLAAQVIGEPNQNNAFGLLFRYISGANTTSSKVAMTVPVAQSEKISMTVPVATSEIAGGRYMQFFLPESYSPENAPKPTDPRVELVLVEGGHYAVYKYSGFANESNFANAKVKLLEIIEQLGITPVSEVIRATYNGPFTLPFMRRNEAMVRIKFK